MNKDVYYLLLKTQKEMYESKIKKQADTLLSYKADYWIKEWISSNSRGAYTPTDYYWINLGRLEKLIDNNAKKDFILKILEKKYNYRKHFPQPGSEYYEMNKNIVALFWDGAYFIPDGKIKKGLKKIVKKLYHYIGKDFASHEDVDTIIHL